MSEHWRIAVDREACLGSGVCAATAPGHFRLDDGRSRPVEDDVEADDIVLDVADMCPAEAITVHDAAGNRLAPDSDIGPRTA
ncbi:ferredoxin [Actinoplanes subtropicus]|uniref:ferredoxin n=1 Tax=Actinoplanes subtropicus TaxID=543632 RepID=UPI0004C3742D|nr:ferredoxin [Actinoplanes subtropicus]